MSPCRKNPKQATHVAPNNKSGKRAHRAKRATTRRGSKTAQVLELLKRPHGAPDADDADELEDNYVYETKATSLKRRLELAGFTRSTLEREFKEAIAQRISYAETHDHDKYGDYRHHLRVLQDTTLEEWMGKLQQVIQQKLRPDHWNSSPLTGDVLIDMLLRPFPYTAHRDDVMSFELYFPCMTFESFARAVLEVVADDAPCVLDVSDLVHGGWTEAFDDLIEYSQDFTTFYQVFSEAITEIRTLDVALPDNPILARLLYANTITAMETYLGDTVKKHVLNRPPLLRRFVESHPGFPEKKVKLSASSGECVGAPWFLEIRGA